ncbi:SdpI family protein [Ensifer sp. HO-A22]|uniref:SdpI family protein n=1 Tax=Ensifer oleiphilus TaxID=2742698 RepID=A0A7Y6Q8N7_9HYPH|nr:SdpI family protein [Ensifer oleiphilus]NVD41153.1 SdpI family protein [Ensifer oleiphilus]
MTSVLRAPLLLPLAAALVATTLSGYLMIPSATELPIHWGIDGKPDAFWPRDRALLTAPLGATVVLVLMAFADRFAPGRQAGRHLVVAASIGILALFVAIQTVIVLIGLGFDVSMVNVIAFAMGLLSVVIGNVMPKSQPNGFAGLRLPWTLADPANWAATHRLTGKLMMAAGILLMLAALALNAGPLLAVVTIAAFMLPFAVGSLYSYIFSRRQGQPSRR